VLFPPFFLLLASNLFYRLFPGRTHILFSSFAPFSFRWCLSLDPFTASSLSCVVRKRVFTFLATLLSSFPLYFVVVFFFFSLFFCTVPCRGKTFFSTSFHSFPPPTAFLGGSSISVHCSPVLYHGVAASSFLNPPLFFSLINGGSTFFVANVSFSPEYEFFRGLVCARPLLPRSSFSRPLMCFFFLILLTLVSRRLVIKSVFLEYCAPLVASCFVCHPIFSSPCFGETLHRFLFVLF